MKLTKTKGLLSIDKREIDELIATKNFVGLNRSPRVEKVIVSLASYKPRINDVKYTIFSLLNQNFPPDKLILWLDEDSFPQREKNLPRDLLELKKFGLTIDWCENLRSYKKLIPALEKFPDDIIVTADDDLFYRSDWLKILYDEHTKNPDCIIAHRAHRIFLNAQGNFLPYTSWQFAVKTGAPFFRNFFTSGAGALFKKNFLNTDVLHGEIFTELTPFGDDIWFWAMAVLNGTKIKIPSAALNYLIYVDVKTQLSGETLWSENKTRNDIQLRRVTEKYPALIRTLIREEVDATPKISVVLLIKNPAGIPVHLENISKQKFPDFELIAINLGARINFPTLPMNFHAVNYSGGSIVDALKLGLQKATGEYILFKDETSFLAKESLEIAAQVMTTSADVIHFSAHVDAGKEIMVSDDKISFAYDKVVFLNKSRQTRASLWFQNKFSRRLDTKLFRREFLTRHGINFDEDLAEFLFQTLVAAGNYLIVPKVFCFCKNV